MLRMCRLKNNKIYDTDKETMIKEVDECLVKLHKANKDSEGRIQCFNASLNIFVTGKRELVEKYGKYIFKEMTERNCKITNKPCEIINVYAMVIFNMFDCDKEQLDILEDYLKRHRGVSLVLLPYLNYSDNVMNSCGDGYYLQLGKKPELAKNKDF